MLDHGPAADPARHRARFAIRVLRADLGNFFFWQYPAVDAYLVTAKNSGTHWFKFMLSVAIAREAGLAEPAHSSGRDGDAIIAHPRWKHRHAGLPFIASSHSIPSIAFGWGLPGLKPRPTVLLVRDIRTALLSNYVKWRTEYGVELGAYLRASPARRFVADIWWYVHFFNRWGDVARAWPGRVLIVRYEDLLADPAPWLQRAGAHLGVTLSPQAVAAGAAYAQKQAVAARLDPEDGETVIPDHAMRASVRFSGADGAYLARLCRRYLRHDFGYDFGHDVESGAA